MNTGSFLIPVTDAGVPTFSLRKSLLLNGRLRDGHDEPQSHMPVSVVRSEMLFSLHIH